MSGSKYFADIPCALTVVPTKAFGSVEAIIEINLVALKNDARRKKEVVGAGLPAMSAYGPCIKAGGVFPSALMAIGDDGAIAASVSRRRCRVLRCPARPRPRKCSRTWAGALQGCRYLDGQRRACAILSCRR